jgi:hypothetical protein
MVMGHKLTRVRLHVDKISKHAISPTCHDVDEISVATRFESDRQSSASVPCAMHDNDQTCETPTGATCLYLS